MDIYSQKGRWKVLLVILGFLIVGTSVTYTNHLAKKLSDEEKRKVELLANVYRQINMATDNSGDLSFLLDIIRRDSTVPVILADKKMLPISWRNIDTTRARKDKAYLPALIETFRSLHDPIKIDLTYPDGKVFDSQYVYYGESSMLRELRMFPLLQTIIVAVFILIGYILFSTSRRAEQNRVWVGMAKETAHQLGTPLTSLSGWVEYFKGTDMDPEIVGELEKDMERLDLVAERFSKIGSEPELTAMPVMPQLQSIIDYLKRRSSGKVTFILDGDQTSVANINPPLFNWGVENIMKNALDAMNGIGTLHIHVNQKAGKTIIDISDTGKGMLKREYKRVFQPGFSTKKRGWGLGLTLTRRIIQQYHKGKVFVLNSEVGKGTTFRIEFIS